MTTIFLFKVMNFNPFMGCYKVIILAYSLKVGDWLQHGIYWTFCLCFKWCEDMGSLGHNLLRDGRYVSLHTYFSSWKQSANISSSYSLWIMSLVFIAIFCCWWKSMFVFMWSMANESICLPIEFMFKCRVYGSMVKPSNWLFLQMNVLFLWSLE